VGTGFAKQDMLEAKEHVPQSVNRFRGSSRVKARDAFDLDIGPYRKRL
jgi:hypothetical protein